MVGSGDTAPAGVPLADSRRDRTPFCTLQASKDQVGVSQAVTGGSHPGAGVVLAGRAGYHESYIAGEQSQGPSQEPSR
jgi:bisphosphoglycerate-independent phosphoglycerate mutase (AlkP superfamily)